MSVEQSETSLPLQLFTFDTWEGFTRQRLQINYENTLALWYSLPPGLPLGKQNVKYYTRTQQRNRLRKLKLYAFYCTLLNRSFLKKKVRARGFKLWNSTLNVPDTQDDSLYSIYAKLGGITEQFMAKGEQYDSTINYEELFKAGRTVWFMIAFQIQMNIKMTLTDSIFGYNMLYPYTDDLVDSNDITNESKKDFAKVFFERLLYGDIDQPKDADPPKFLGDRTPADSRLPSSLTAHADRVGKIFDMVKFIENDWSRLKYKEVYYGLATIHECQMKSTLQHATDDYIPQLKTIEEISAQKGGASLIAAGFLIEGTLTYEKMAHLEYLGFGLQLLDDLQDVQEDLKNNHRTIFTQAICDHQSLDIPTGKLIQYYFCSRAGDKFEEDKLINQSANATNTVTLAQYVRISMVNFSLLLILEAASKLEQYYSKQFYHDLNTLSPLSLKDLAVARIEDRIFNIVRHQWF